MYAYSQHSIKGKLKDMAVWHYDSMKFCCICPVL